MPLYNDSGELYPEENLKPPWWVAAVFVMAVGLVLAAVLFVLVYAAFG